MRGDAFLVAAALIGAFGSTAEANPRFHVLGPRLEQRLSARARQNLQAVARVGKGRGTAFLVDGVPGRDATGLVVTNDHVGAGTFAGEVLTFRDGAEARVRRVLASSTRLDYAILEVDLPAAAAARPLRLRAGAVGRGEKVYALSAAANPFVLRPPLAETTVVRRGAVFDEETRRWGTWTIQAGAESGNAMLRLDGGVWSVSFGLPNAPGASGSPVLSAGQHDVVALHWGGNGRPAWRSSATPVYAILDDLRRMGLPETARLLAGRE